MKKKTSKDRPLQITMDLIKRAAWPLDELTLNYVIIVEDIDVEFSNVNRRHAMAIIRDHLQLQDKVDETKVEDKALKLSDIYPDTDDEGPTKK
jgi:hypothetical protein